jgi:hypothetical protein
VPPRVRRIVHVGRRKRNIIVQQALEPARAISRSERPGDAALEWGSLEGVGDRNRVGGVRTWRPDPSSRPASGPVEEISARRTAPAPPSRQPQPQQPTATGEETSARGCTTQSCMRVIMTIVA